MATELRNIISVGDQTLAGTTNPRNAAFGQAAGLLRGVKPYGDIDPARMVQTRRDLLFRSDAWRSSALNTGTGGMNFIQGTVPGGLMRLRASATANHGHQVQESVDGGTTGFAKYFFPATGDLSFYAAARLRLGHGITSTFLFGVGAVSTTVLSAASAINITDFVGFHKPAGATALNGVLRASGAQTDLLVGQAGVDWTLLEMRVNGNRQSVEFALNGVRVIQTSLANLPVAGTNLALTLAYTTSTNTQSDLDVHGVFAGQEGY
jgi:hypothetical protein